jgi:hypothetical protein
MHAQQRGHGLSGFRTYHAQVRPGLIFKCLLKSFVVADDYSTPEARKVRKFRLQRYLMEMIY